jgi:hypothetical protein
MMGLCVSVAGLRCRRQAFEMKATSYLTDSPTDSAKTRAPGCVPTAAIR